MSFHIEARPRQQTGPRSKTRLVIVIALVAVLAGFAGGYAFAAEFQGGTLNYSKPGSYTANIVSSPLVLNGLFINWNGNSIYLNITNTASANVNATVTFYFYNGSSVTPFINSFSSVLSPGIHPAQPYGNWPIQIKTLVVGSTIRVEV